MQTSVVSVSRSCSPLYLPYCLIFHLEKITLLPNWLRWLPICNIVPCRIVNKNPGIFIEFG